MRMNRWPTNGRQLLGVSGLGDPGGVSYCRQRPRHVQRLRADCGIDC